MNLSRKGLLLAAIQLAIVLSLGAKLLYDRAVRPRTWARTENFDPDLPIRGRYLALTLRVIPEGFSYQPASQPGASDWWINRQWGYLSARKNQLVASGQGPGPGMWIHVQKSPSGEIIARTEEPVLVLFQKPSRCHPSIVETNSGSKSLSPPRAHRVPSTWPSTTQTASPRFTSTNPDSSCSALDASILRFDLSPDTFHLARGFLYAFAYTLSCRQILASLQSLATLALHPTQPL